MKRITRPAYLLALSLALGCSGPAANNTAQKTEPAATENKTAATLPQPVVVNAVGTEPGQVVAVFLDSLRRGDEKTANSVLTSLARQEVQKANYQIQPPGSPEGKYEIGRVAYLPENDKVALVECNWIDPAAAGQKPDVTEIVCEVHQETDGWRISGLGFKLAGMDETLTVDFENAKALNETIDAATAAFQPPAAGTAPNNGAAQPAPQTGTQIALPPVNNAPVRR